MSEPAKFALKDTLWRNLPSQYLEDSLLCSSPHDALKWLLVSKDIKEVIEENRDKMRLFENGSFCLQVNRYEYIYMSCGEPKESLYVRCYAWANDPTPTFSMLDYYPVGWSDLKWRLVDTSVAGMKRFVTRITHWFAIDAIRLPPGCPNSEMFRPLAENGVCIRFGEYNDAVMDTIESLHIKNIHISVARQVTISDSFLRRIHEMPFENVSLHYGGELVKHLDCASIDFNGRLTAEEFHDAIVMPWFDGERPRLKSMKLRRETKYHFGPKEYVHLFERVDYVPTKSEVDYCEDYGCRGYEVRAYCFADKTGEHFMEIKTEYDYYFDEDASWTDYSKFSFGLELRIID